jgi:transcriptional regulator with XRE-family HTH domain
MHLVAWGVRPQRQGSKLADVTFGERLALVMKSLAISRGQLALRLAIDKSLVSRWLSGATIPNGHNLTRLTLLIAETVPGFTMFDWDGDAEALRRRLGLDRDAASPPGASVITPGIVPDLAQPLADLPNFARLAAFAPAMHETTVQGDRYCGLWQAWMPTFGHPERFHCEHTVLWQEGAWLAGFALGVSYRWPLVGFIANNQLLLVMSDSNDFVLRQFNRANEPIIDQVDGLMLAAASLPHQAPTASRVIMARVLDAAASRDEIDTALATFSASRRFLTAEELPEDMAAALLPDSGPKAATNGGDRLLRADPAQALVRSRWY